MTGQPKTQAQKIFDRFGGVRALHNAILRLPNSKQHRSISALYRWNLPRPTGSGGLIPTCAIPDVLAAARLEGIRIDGDDLYPTRRS